MMLRQNRKTSLGAMNPSCLAAILVSFCVIAVQTDTPKENVPPSPFRVVWNYPDMTCIKHRFDFELSKYGIIANEPRTFTGNEIATLYSVNSGLWPRFQDRNMNTPVNGGIPQLANLTAHLDQLRKDIISLIPENSTGYGVLDQEDWRPLYDLNFGVLSVNKEASEIEAKKTGRSPEEEFNKSAREMMERSLLEARAVRPGVHWGYYLFPRTWKTDSSTRDINNRMSWIYKSSTGIYPSIYLKNKEQISDMKRWVESTLKEAFRVRALYSKPNTPVVAYTLVQDTHFFSKDLLNVAIGLAAEMGIDGVVIWGSSSRFKPNPKDKCQGIQNYMREVLGPYVSQLMEKLTNCSESLCGGRGRCVNKGYAKFSTHLTGRSVHKRQIQPDSVRDQIDPDLRQDGYKLSVDASSGGDIKLFSTPSDQKYVSVWNRTRDEMHVEWSSLSDNKHGRINEALNMFRTAFLRAQTRNINDGHHLTFPYNQNSNTGDISKYENNNDGNRSNIAELEGNEYLAHQGFQTSQSAASKTPLTSATASINNTMNNSLPINTTNTDISNSLRKGFNVAYTGLTLLSKLVDVYNYVANHLQNYTLSLRSDDSSVEGSTMNQTSTTHSDKLSSNRSAPTNVPVNTTNHPATVVIAETENNPSTPAPGPEKRSTANLYDNYVCVCYSQWKGPFCEHDRRR